MKEEEKREEKKGKEQIDATMLHLFRTELETQTAALNAALLNLEKEPSNRNEMQTLMRAAHSIKGAARVVGVMPIVTLAHAMEGFFSAVQLSQTNMTDENIDFLFRSIDLLGGIARSGKGDFFSSIDLHAEAIAKVCTALNAMTSGLSSGKAPTLPPSLIEEQKGKATTLVVGSTAVGQKEKKADLLSPEEKSRLREDHHLRITVEHLNKIMGLAGESLVESRWLQPFVLSLINLKKSFESITTLLDALKESLPLNELTKNAQGLFFNLHEKNKNLKHSFSDRITELEMFMQRYTQLSEKLYGEVIDSRMRPFADAVEGFPRMARDMAKQLNKKIKLELIGTFTPVDRDILEKLKTPLSHLLRNAIDHGIESPEERIAQGKDPEGTIKIEARHRAGMLAITFIDDGRGPPLEELRKGIVKRGLASAEDAEAFRDEELIDFMFSPGFSTSKNVTEISGRGIGLNIVQNMVKEVGGSLRTKSQPGKAMSFYLQLPLTLSIIRGLLVQIAGELYAFPLSRIERIFNLSSEEIESIGGRRYFKLEERNIALISAAQVLQMEEKHSSNQQRLPIILISDQNASYGLIVEKCLNEKELVVQKLNPQLGKIPNISSGAFLEDRSPVLIINVEEMVSSISALLTNEPSIKTQGETPPTNRPWMRHLIS